MRFLEQVFELSRVRVLVFLREPEVLFWVFAFPVVLAIVLGFAFRRSEIEPNPVAVLAGEGATELEARLARAERLDVTVADDLEEALQDLFKGVVDVVVEPGDPPVLHLDPQRPEAETARLRVLLALEGREPPAVRIEASSKSGTRYLDFLFPGLIGMNLMSTGMWVIGFAIAEMRQKKVLRRMLVTPMRRSAFLLSLLTARTAFLLLELVALVAVAVWLLDVPFRSSVLGFLALAVLGGTLFAGLGGLVTARARTIQGASGMLNLAMLPSWLLSGVFFSYERFPEVLHPLLRLLPLTALNDALRGMMLDGDGFADLGFELAVMSVWCFVSFALTLRIFRWE